MTIVKVPYLKALRRFTIKGKKPKTKIYQGTTKSKQANIKVNSRRFGVIVTPFSRQSE